MCVATTLAFFARAGAAEENGEAWASRLRMHTVRSIIFATVGGASWLLDFFACATFGPLKLHAFGWHIFTALALQQAARGGAILVFVPRSSKRE
jgi:hypothetical protein